MSIEVQKLIATGEQAEKALAWAGGVRLVACAVMIVCSFIAIPVCVAAGVVFVLSALNRFWRLRRLDRALEAAYARRSRPENAKPDPVPENDRYLFWKKMFEEHSFADAEAWGKENMPDLLELLEFLRNLPESEALFPDTRARIKAMQDAHEATAHSTLRFGPADTPDPEAADA